MIPLSDDCLLQKMKVLVQEEKKHLNVLLRHLQEIENRRLFSKLGYTSLFDYATKALGYAEDEACRRISSMRMLREMPELESKIESGDLTLTALNLANTQFRAEKKVGFGRNKEQKLEILGKMEKKTKREVEKILAASSPLEKIAVPQEKVRELSEKEVELKLVCSQDFMKKVEHLKALLAHSHPGASMAEILEYACDQTLTKVDPMKNAAQKASAPKREASRHAPARVSRYIPAKVRNMIWQKYEGKCARCGSQYALQMEHSKPFALGGSNWAENLILLCRNCNQQRAVEVFGRKKMCQYLKT